MDLNQPFWVNCSREGLKVNQEPVNIREMGKNIKNSHGHINFPTIITVDPISVLVKIMYDPIFFNTPNNV